MTSRARRRAFPKVIKCKRWQQEPAARMRSALRFPVDSCAAERIQRLLAGWAADQGGKRLSEPQRWCSGGIEESRWGAKEPPPHDSSPVGHHRRFPPL